MIIARVSATVVATQKDSHLVGKTLLLVQPLNLDLQPVGTEYMAFDAAQAGIGDLVLVCNEGGSANRVFGSKKAPYDSVIVGVIDSIDLH